ncbi:MAG: ROK family protein [Phocaeicola sp.]
MIFHPEKLQKTVIGLFFAGKKLQAARIEKGVAVQIINKEINNRESEEFIINELLSVIEQLHDPSVSGIGIGVPSLVDVKNGIVYKPTHIPSWRKVHLKEIIEDRFSTPTFINNDANCFTMGEKYFGSAKAYDDVVGVTIGAGLGVGIIANGVLYSGNNCGAGEFCSIPYRDHDYEYYCSAGYFEEKYGIDYKTLALRSKRKDKIALAILEQFGFDLGNAIKTIVYALDPQIIIIGGYLSESYPYFEEAMHKKLNTFIYPETIKKLVVRCSETANIATFGAAALCFEKKELTL